MTIRFSNTNSVWASVLVETLYRVGLTTAVICPGSRSAPLAIAFAEHPQIEAIPILDERSAAFFALGLARRSGRPVALVCTSGTAGANFYPAVIEAREGRVPLLILTGDRPPELRECNAGQTVDQQKLFGSFPNWYAELSVPELDLRLLAYLRQTLLHAWERTLSPVPGAVHLNQPFRDPLAPIPQNAAQAFAREFPADFFEGITPSDIAPVQLEGMPVFSQVLPLEDWQASDRGIILAGVAQPYAPEAYCRAIAQLSQALGFPVLAEGLSPLRNFAALVPHLVSTYDLLLRQSIWAEKLAPSIVVRIGEMPTSKVLRDWLSETQPRQWVIDPGDRNLDPLHLPTTYLRASVEAIIEAIAPAIKSPAPAPISPYLHLWHQAEQQTRQQLDQALGETPFGFEGRVAWELSRCLPEDTSLFIANSTQVRNVEWFWQPGNRRIRPWVNRGANGIDGTLSTALGIAHQNPGTVLLTGDLALLHDTNGFLISPRLSGHLTIVLINNHGGGIFERLPIHQFDPPFEDFFATPQTVDFEQLCQTYGVEYERIHSWEHLRRSLHSLPSSGVRLLEIRSDRKADARWFERFIR